MLLATSCFALYPTNVGPEKLFGHYDVFSCNWIAYNCIHTQHRLEIIYRRRAQSVIQITSPLRSFELTLHEKGLVLFNCIQ